VSGPRPAYDRAVARGAAALDDVRAGDKVFVSSGCAEPGLLVGEIVERAHDGRLPACELYMMFGGSSGRLHDAAGPGHRVVTVTATPASGPSFFPWTIHQTARLLQEDRLRFDVAVLQTSPPDASGRLSLGISVDFAADAVRQARLIVAEVNEQMPRTFGADGVEVDRLDGAVEVDRPLLQRQVPASSESSRAVAEHVAPLIPDGATIEIGVGRVMSDVLRSLAGHRDLGLHTGLLVDEMVELIDAGVITNRRKSTLTGVSVANQVRGTDRTYRFLHENPTVEVRPARFTHDAAVLAQLPAFHAINSALQVDLMGRVNSEMRGGQRVSSTGGLGDFVRSAAGRVDGRSIIALSAVGRSGASRIVPVLADAASVTLAADLADVVVTEFGVANLRGLMPDQRAAAMIAIADPRHRDALSASVA
jgi:acyl-CoA hydrolase